ncbi:MAG: hypothetical protein ACFFA3_01210 [Promethearchaeota archaeon]
MDSYDKDISLVNKNDEFQMWLKYLKELINKKTETLSILQFKNYKLLTLAIWEDNFVKKYFKRSIERNELSQDLKETIITILRAKLK